MTTLTEDNKDIYIEFQNHPEYSQMLFDVLRKFQTPETILVRVLACGNVWLLRGKNVASMPPLIRQDYSHFDECSRSDSDGRVMG